LRASLRYETILPQTEYIRAARAALAIVPNGNPVTNEQRRHEDIDKKK
jgi:hypothetical protein